MSILFELADIVKDCELKAKKLLIRESILYSEEIVQRSENTEKLDNILYYGDNINAILDLLNNGYKGKIDLIYIDPPFYTNASYSKQMEIDYLGEKKVIQYKAYSDIYKNGFKEYLEMITIRLFLMRELLSDRGSIYVHIDFRTVHYIKIIMDYIFGSEFFLNEIIWSYKSGGSSKKHFSRKHDNILVYTKTKDYIFNPQKEKSYNRGYKPYRFKGVTEYEDKLGWYTLVNLKDVWQIDMVGRTSRERIGYETQKPEALLERIILTSSDDESIVADFFSGSGTTIAVAEKSNRSWIGSDSGKSSIATIMKRLATIDSKAYNIINFNKDLDIGYIKYKSISYDKTDRNTFRIDISLERYNLDLENLNINKKDIDIISEILENDSLSLVDYICIKIGKDAPIIVYEDYRFGKSLRIKESFSFIIDRLNDDIELNIIDVFGNLSKNDIKLLSQ